MEIKNKYGYVRVSSKTQESNSSIESQKQQLIQNGIEKFYIYNKIKFCESMNFLLLKRTILCSRLFISI